MNSVTINHLSMIFVKIRYKKLIFMLLLVPLFILFSLMSIDYGVMLQYQTKAGPLRDTVIEAIVTNFGVFNNIVNALNSKPERVSIDIPFKNFQKIAYLRKISLTRGGIKADVKNDQIPAKLTYQGKTYRVKLQMTGVNLDHLGHEQKWSLRVKVRGGKTVFGMKEFSLLNPHSRLKISEWVYHQFEKAEGLISLKYEHCQRP